MTPAVSICVPVYNGAPYLAQCLDSIMAQTFTDFELIIVDDCSKDDSVAIANDYASRDPRVRVESNTSNLGLVGNWNRCVELARGEWIKFVFQDDLIAPECVTKMVAAGREGHVIVSCARDFIFEQDTSDDDRRYYLKHQHVVERFWHDNDSMSAEEFSRAILQSIGDNPLGEPTCVLLHRSVFDDYGEFNTYLIHDVDLEYWTRVGSNAGVRHLNEVLATFRVHTKSMSSTNKGRALRKLVDPVLIRHDVAFHPVYATLRNVASNAEPPVNFVSEFWHLAHEVLIRRRAGTTLMRARGNVSSDDAHRFFTAYPRLKRIPLEFRLRAFARRNLQRVYEISGRDKSHPVSDRD